MKTVIPKSEARRQVIERMKDLPESSIVKLNNLIYERLKSDDDFIKAKSVFCYVDGRDCETATRGLINYMHDSGKSVYLPKININSKTFSRFHFESWDKLIKNNRGFWEPQLSSDMDLGDIDLFIIPSAAATETGHRVGYGGGYYDEFLKNCHSLKYTLVREFQLFGYIESTRRDIRVDKIFTERRTIITSKSAFRF